MRLIVKITKRTTNQELRIIFLYLVKNGADKIKIPANVKIVIKSIRRPCKNERKTIFNDKLLK
jgi:hypothetical protein